MGIGSEEPKSTTPRAFHHLNGGLLFAKANFFFLYGASAIILPALSVYGHELGLNAASVGVVLTVVPFIVFLVRPLVAGISDRLQKITPVLVSIIVLEAVSLLLISSVPSLKTSSEQDTGLSLQLNLTTSNATGSLLGIESEFCMADHFRNSSVHCFLTCPCQRGNHTSRDNVSEPCILHRSVGLQPVPAKLPSEFYLVNNESESLQSAGFGLEETVVTCSANCSVDLSSCLEKAADSATASEDMHSLQFWLFLLLTCLIRIAISSAFSLSDTACFQQLGDRPQDYGLQRLWGTIGWGIMAPLSGLLIDFVNARLGYKSFVPGFYMAVGLMAIQCIIGFNWWLGPSKSNQSILRNVGGLLRKPRHLCFLLDIFVVGSCSSIHWYYIYWYLTDLHASKLLMGLTLATQSFLGDLPFMFLSGWLISKLKHINVVRLAFLGFFLKFLGYSFLRDPWWAIAIELLQGPTYGSFYVAMTSYARSISVPGTEATFLSIIQGVFDCLGIAAGSCLGGLGLSYFGARKTYFIASFVPLVWLVLTVLIGQLITRCSSSEQDKVVVEAALESAQPFMSSKSNRKDHSDQQAVEKL
ncbi:major facilitator superfamily domain-containing protein 6-like [Dermacentor albipictus]|uniref:major facilitator superfamily domain-containing protein 6-like n=1 Tax=Dermacentor albipictus TaxID=60249 RepID=UPI0031FBD86F